MKLQENIQRIKQMMGLITESEMDNFDDMESDLITKKGYSAKKDRTSDEDTPASPNLRTITGSYTTPLSNCDRLHAFNDTGSGPVGRMNDIVNPELIKMYESGINPDITDVVVDIKRGSTEYKVNWSVTIGESEDGVAYVGLYSRGHGGRGKWVFDDVSTTSGHASISSCKTSSFIKKRGTVEDMILVNDFEFNKDGKIPGCQVNQLFYKYTLKEYPSH